MRQLAYLIPLLIRPRAMRAGAAATMVVAFAAALAWGVLQALQLSPEQKATEVMGAAKARVWQYDETGENGPGKYPAAPKWASVGSVETAYETTIAVRLDGNVLADQVSYLEFDPSWTLAKGRMTLDSGAWPANPGECVTNLDTSAVHPTVGDWPLKLVGRTTDVFDPNASVLLCAPGTWGQWSLKAGTATAFSQSLDASYYFTGSTEEVDAVLAPLLADGEIQVYDLMTRTRLIEAPTTSSQEFLAVLSIAILLLVSIPLAFSTRVASWAGKVQIVLSQSGIPRAMVRRAILLTLAVGTAVSSLLAGTVGSLAALAARPLLQRLGDGGPLGPWDFHLMVILASVLLATVGALLGFVFGTWRDDRRLSMRSRSAMPLSAGRHRVFVGIGILCMVASFVVIGTSSGRFWPMAIGVLIGVAAGACFAPSLGLLCARRLARSQVGPSSLAGRLIVEDGQRWATVLLGLAAVVTAVSAVFINMTASVAAQTQLLLSPVPEDMLFVQMPSEDSGGKALLISMEQEIGVEHAATVRQTDYSIDDLGPVFALSSLDDAAVVLGPLDKEASAALARGDILRPGGPTEDVVLHTVQGATADAHLVAYRPADGHHLGLAAGWSLGDALPEGGGGRELWVYNDLDTQKLQRIRNWPDSSGNNMVVIHGPTDQGGALPIYTTAGFAVLALICIPMCLWAMRREVEGLRPLARGLDAMGLPGHWIWTVLAMIGAVLVAVPVALGLAVAVGTTGALQIIYPPIYDLAGANWLGMALVVAVFAAVVPLVATLGVRGVRRHRRSEVI